MVNINLAASPLPLQQLVANVQEPVGLPLLCTSLRIIHLDPQAKLGFVQVSLILFLAQTVRSFR